MAKHNILSVEEIEHFLERVRATVHAAQESHSLREALAALVGRGHGTSGTPSPVQSQSGGESHSQKGGNGGGKGGRAAGIGRLARVDESQIMELLRKGANGVGMRELEKALGQHVETIRLKLRKLRKEGHVRTTGPRNQLRYHHVGNVGTGGGGGETAASLVGGGEEKARGRGGSRAHNTNHDPFPANTGAGTGKGRGRGGKRAAAKAEPDGFADRLVDLIRTAGANGTQMNHLAAELKLDPKSIRKTLERLRQSGAIQVIGQRRATRYHAAT